MTRKKIGVRGATPIAPMDEANLIYDTFSNEGSITRMAITHIPTWTKVTGEGFDPAALQTLLLVELRQTVQNAVISEILDIMERFVIKLEELEPDKALVRPEETVAEG